jgi:NAD(P)-dependent dehydrogenase (short-subunit alcohol dehydrogenase family)
MRITDTTFILTGASLGIGRALAEGLAREGVHLVLNARSDDALRGARDACRRHGVRAEHLSGDIADPETAAGLVALAKELGGPDGFIHAAGLLRPGPTVWELNSREFAQVMGASLTGAHQLIHHAVPELIERGRGWAVFFGSGAAEIQQPGIGAYCAAKAAEESLARQLAAETDTVCSFIYRPGVVETRMQSLARQAEGGAADLLRPVFRSWKEQDVLISPEEAAQALVGLLDRDPGELHGGTWDVREI